MTRKVKVSYRKAYGKEFFDPLNEGARIFCELAKQKSLTLADLRCIKRLGHQVVVQTSIAFDASEFQGAAQATAAATDDDA